LGVNIGSNLLPQRVKEAPEIRFREAPDHTLPAGHHPGVTGFALNQPILPENRSRPEPGDFTTRLNPHFAVFYNKQAIGLRPCFNHDAPLRKFTGHEPAEQRLQLRWRERPE